MFFVPEIATFYHIQNCSSQVVIQIFIGPELQTCTYNFKGKLCVHNWFYSLIEQIHFKFIIIISYFPQAHDWSIAVTWPCYKFCYRPYYTKNRKFIDLTILKIDFHDKILVLARATLWRHNSEINTYTLWTKYFTVIILKWASFLSNIINIII